MTKLIDKLTGREYKVIEVKNNILQLEYEGDTDYSISLTDIKDAEGYELL